MDGIPAVPSGEPAPPAMKTFAAALWLVFLFAGAILLPRALVLPVGGMAAALGFGGLYGLRAWLRGLGRREQHLAAGVGLAGLAPLGFAERLLGLRDTQDEEGQLALLRARKPWVLGLGVAMGMLGLGGVLLVVIVYGD